MNDPICACGYEAGSDDDLADHVGDMMIPDDDTAPDGMRHAEAAGQAGHRCLCGFTAGTGPVLDEHLLGVFMIGDAIGRDGHGHGVVEPPHHGVWERFEGLARSAGMRYLVQEKLFSFTRDFWIEDETGGHAFLVDGSGPFSREAFTLRDANGNVRVLIRRKAFAWRETLRIEDGAGNVIASVRAAFALFKQRYEITLFDGRQLEAAGNFTGKDFQIRDLDGLVYGQMSRERWRMRDTYWVDVPDGPDPALIIAIAICIDRIHADAQRAHAAQG